MIAFLLLLAAEGPRVHLDGSRSCDPDAPSAPLVFRWHQVSGPPVELHDADLARPWFVPESPGEYVFELAVSSGGKKSAPSRHAVSVLPPNSPPRADPGPDQTVFRGSWTILDGSRSSDPDGDPIVSWRWKRASGRRARMVMERSSRPRVEFDEEGVYVFSLVVSDGLAESAPAYVTVKVVPRDAPPVADARGVKVVRLKHPLVGGEGTDENSPPVAKLKEARASGVGGWSVIDASDSSDPDGDELTFLWYQIDGPFVRTLHPARGRSVMRFKPKEAGRYVFKLIVTDGLAESPPILIELQVGPALPGAGPGSHIRAEVGKLAWLIGPKLKGATWHWRQVLGKRVTDVHVLRASGGRTVSFVPAAPGFYGFELVVEKQGACAPAALYGVIAVWPNRPPRICLERRLDCVPGEKVVLRARAFDPDGDRLRFEWKRLRGPRLEWEGDGASLRARPAREGDYVFELSASDGREEARARVELRVRKRARPPVAVLWGPTEARPGERPVVDGSRSFSPAGRRLSYRWEAEGAEVRARGKKCELTPNSEGVCTVRLTVSDGEAESSAEWTVLVRARERVRARGRCPRRARAGEWFALDGRASAGDARWRRLGGPECELVQLAGGLGYARARSAGTVEFELLARGRGSVHRKRFRVRIDADGT